MVLIFLNNLHVYLIVRKLLIINMREKVHIQYIGLIYWIWILLKYFLRILSLIDVCWRDSVTTYAEINTPFSWEWSSSCQLLFGRLPCTLPCLVPLILTPDWFIARSIFLSIPNIFRSLMLNQITKLIRGLVAKLFYKWPKLIQLDIKTTINSWKPRFLQVQTWVSNILICPCYIHS